MAYSRALLLLNFPWHKRRPIRWSWERNDACGLWAYPYP